MWKKGHPESSAGDISKNTHLGDRMIEWYWARECSVSIGLELNVWILQSPKYNHEWWISTKNSKQFACFSIPMFLASNY